MATQTYTPASSDILHHVEVDMSTRRQITEPIHLVQYDNLTPILEVSLFNGDTVYTCPSDTTVSVRYEKPDNKVVYNPVLGWNSIRTIIYVRVTNQMTASYGEANAILEVKVGNKIAGSANFKVIVERNPVQDGAIESSDEMIDLQAYVDEAKAAANQAKNSASSASTSASNANTYKSQAQTFANTSSTQASNARTAANEAKTAEANALNSEQKAKASETSAASHEANSKNYADKAQSYAVGTNNVVRPNDATDNSKYYYEQTKHMAQGVNGLVPMGTITFAELPVGDDILKGAMYNISDSFISDERFTDGGGVVYGAGSNVYWIEADQKWDVTASSAVYGVKGNEETEYRQGMVNLTAEDIGAVEVDGDISGNTVTFEQAVTRAGISSSDSMSVAFGKLAKYCADLENAKMPYWSLEGGINIQEGDDILDEKYDVPGNYICKFDRVAEGLTNCPVKKAFTMKVEAISGDLKNVRRTLYITNSRNVYMCLKNNYLDNPIIIPWTLSSISALDGVTSNIQQQIDDQMIFTGSAMLSEPGWYRILDLGTSPDTNNIGGDGLILDIWLSRAYNNTQNESHRIVMSFAFMNNISFDELSGYTSANRLVKMRISYNNSNKHVYLEVNYLDNVNNRVQYRIVANSAYSDTDITAGKFESTSDDFTMVKEFPINPSTSFQNNGVRQMIVGNGRNFNEYITPNTIGGYGVNNVQNPVNAPMTPFREGTLDVAYSLGQPYNTQDKNLQYIRQTYIPYTADMLAMRSVVDDGSITPWNLFYPNGVKELNSENLNDVKVLGNYFQYNPNNATTDRNYPINNAGFLEVLPSKQNYVLQRYTMYNGSQTYQRSFLSHNDSWSSWQLVGCGLKGPFTYNTVLNLTIPASGYYSLVDVSSNGNPVIANITMFESMFMGLYDIRISHNILQLVGASGITFSNQYITVTYFCV